MFGQMCQNVVLYLLLRIYLGIFVIYHKIVNNTSYTYGFIADAVEQQGTLLNVKIVY